MRQLLGIRNQYSEVVSRSRNTGYESSGFEFEFYKVMSRITLDFIAELEFYIIDRKHGFKGFMVRARRGGSVVG